MIKKLRDILNTYTDQELEAMDIWINSNDKVDSIWIERDDINLITDDANVSINNFIDKESCIERDKNGK